MMSHDSRVYEVYIREKFLYANLKRNQFKIYQPTRQVCNKILDNMRAGRKTEKYTAREKIEVTSSAGRCANCSKKKQRRLKFKSQILFLHSPNDAVTLSYAKILLRSHLALTFNIMLTCKLRIYAKNFSNMPNSVKILFLRN
jgi:hypothetical protein